MMKPKTRGTCTKREDFWKKEDSLSVMNWLIRTPRLYMLARLFRKFVSPFLSASCTHGNLEVAGRFYFKSAFHKFSSIFIEYAFGDLNFSIFIITVCIANFNISIFNCHFNFIYDRY